MLVQVNSDNNVVTTQELIQKVQAEVEATLGRFDSELTRVEVFLSDVDGPKSDTLDKRCVIEARPAGHEPLDVSDQAAALADAVSGALSKMERVLNDHFDKLRDSRRHRG
jgi:hypothetical protein